jgi:hypothetical protein
MIKTDLTARIMKKVIRYETNKLAFWLTLVFSFLLALLVFAGMLFAYTAFVLSQTRSLELLSLFREDSEIISEYWRETMNVFFAEIPLREILIFILLVTVIVAVSFTVFNKRFTIKKKISSIVKYRKVFSDK